MFKNIFYKEKFPTFLFVISSISALILIMIILIGLALSVNNKSGNKNLGPTDAKYQLKDFKNDDEYITKNPKIKDLLAGPIISSDDPQLGNVDSPITIVEYSDFECAYCQKQEKILKQAMSKYKLNLIWKDFPENNPSSLSYQAALAARCAQQQNKFWEYHDLLYSGQKLTKQLLMQYAEEVNLNMTKFNTCLSNKETSSFVKNNIEEANGLDITGIPFIYVNDQEIMGEISYDDLSKIIREKSK